MFLGATKRTAGTNSVTVLDWTHQPWGRGANARPIAEDSAVVTIQIAAKFTESAQQPQDSHLTDAFVALGWSAAGGASQEAEVDLQMGTSISLIATHVRAMAVFRFSDPASTQAIEINATIGRGARPSYSEQPTRTKTAGELVQNAVSAAIAIPPYARSLAVVTPSLPPAFSVRVTQKSAGVIVQVDDVVGPNPTRLVTINGRADTVTITNLGAVAKIFLAVFRIGL
jgi:hypothetical protein